MKTYQEIIKENDAEFNDGESLIDFLDNYTNEAGDDVRDQEDNISEYADGLVPIYYNDIVKEWHENGECHEMTLEVCGEYAEKDIYKMMTSDLYFYYEQQLREDYNKFIELMDEQEDDEDETNDEDETDDEAKKEMAIEAGLTEDEAERQAEDIK